MTRFFRFCSHVLVTALFSFWLVSCGSSKDAGIAPSVVATEIPATREPAVVILPLGQMARGENVEVTILDFALVDSEGLDVPAAGMQLMRFDVQVRNLASQPVALQFLLRDVEGMAFEQAAQPDDVDELPELLPVGYASSTVVTFLVQDGDRPNTLLYGDASVTWALQLGMPRPGN